MFDGGRVRLHSAVSQVSQVIIELLVAKIFKNVLFLSATPLPASAQMKMQLTKRLIVLGPSAVACVNWVILTQSLLYFIEFYSVPGQFYCYHLR